jgi:general transcription factor 3C polypeptide 3 (transcription factor C subunit 4)
LVEDALRFYVPVQQTSEYADVSFYMSMGDCYMRLNKLEDAENCYLTVTEHDAGNVESRAQLAKLYENIGMTDHAFKYVNEAVLLERQETRSRRRGKDTRLDHLAREFRAAELTPEAEHLPAIDHPPESVPATTLTTGQAAAMGKKREAEGEGEDEDDRTENVQFLHSKMLQLQQKIKEGDTEAIEDWLDIADALLHDFRSNRIFYPVQRSVVFLGYSREARKSAGKHNKRHVMDEMREMAGRLQQSLGK